MTSDKNQFRDRALRLWGAKAGPLTILLLLFTVSLLNAQQNPALQNLVEKRLQNQNCSAILIAPDRGTVLASLNAEPILREKHPPGSLMKVFTLIAYAQTHGGKFPEFRCPPSLAKDSSGCWDRNGHGIVNAQKGLAFSCNVYFRQLAAETSIEAYVNTVRQFGILEPNEEWNDPQVARKLMTGVTLEWSASPLRLLRAYCSLFNGGTLWKLPGSIQSQRSILPSVDVLNLIRNGLHEGAMHGTSSLARSEAGVEMLGKTGTSLMIVNGRTDYSRTQGWWIGLYPANDPEIAIMTFVRNGRGASDAAPNGGRALAAWLDFSKRITMINSKDTKK